MLALPIAVFVISGGLPIRQNKQLPKAQHGAEGDPSFLCEKECSTVENAR